MILAVAISIGVGIVFSVAPALKAARKNPIDALRGE
jgi:ABC-type antimicrobial peptide transport system permease subunit